MTAVRFDTGIIGWRFIFPLPALFSAALVIALVAAYVAAGQAGVPLRNGT